jgi:UDP-glucose 4-epimerase
MNINSFLIVGSKGFIGSNLVQYLKDAGYEVWGADVVVDYVAAEQYSLVDATNANFHELFETRQFDVCVNCSGAASVPDSFKNPLRDFELNCANVYAILDAIRMLQPECRFINLSSAVYGNPEKVPIKEESSLTPISPYGFHKRSSEDICKEFNYFFGVLSCSLRIFSAFGDGLKKQLFWDLYHRAKTEDPLRLYGSGKESRDFVYIGDLVRAIECVAQRASCNGEAINVGNGREVLIEDAVACFFENFDHDVTFEFSGEERKGDPNNWSADITKLNSLGYTQSFPLEVGLERYYRWLISQGLD